MTIGFWGDSITYGSRDEEALGWVGRVRRSLPVTEHNTVYNFGICGNNTFDLLRRFSVEAEGKEFDKIFFVVGTNDAKFSVEKGVSLVSENDFELNLRKLIKQARNHTKEVVVIGSTVVNENVKHGNEFLFRNKEIKKYNQLAEKVASESGLDFIDMFFVLDPEIDLFDGVHPNTVGYQKLFEYIAPKLRLDSLLTQ